MKMYGRKPKLTEVQQIELRNWNRCRVGTLRAKAVTLGINETTVRNYLRGKQKVPVRKDGAP
jgi:hypothetical protein